MDGSIEAGRHSGTRQDEIDLSKVTSRPANINDLRRKPYQSRIIVAGSRNFTDIVTFRRVLSQYLVAEHKDKYIAFISGKAKRGPDRFIIDWCALTPFVCYEFEAQWDALGKRAGFVRNEEMSLEASHLLAFWDGESRGTENMIKLAKERSLVVHSFNTKTTNVDFNGLNLATF